MKRWIGSLLAALTVTGVFAQTGGRVLENGRLDSKVLKMKRNFSICLPEGYERDERSYPVLYLLHGLGDDHTGWVQFGEVQRIAEQAVADGTSAPMIIVMPDANTGRVGYFNDLRGDWRYEDFFFDELIPYVESHYRVRPEKRYRAVAGLSMGGGGTVAYVLHRPEMFAAACPLSAYLGPSDYDQFRRGSGPIFRNEGADGLPGEQVKAYFQQYSPFEWIGSQDEEGLKKIRSVAWYVDCGDDDFLSRDNCRFHILLREMRIPHEFRMRDGAHNWTYWRESLREVLRFCSDRFRQK